jgi:anti-sigma regulatory factor (Ser/Thr protein kinase)
VLDSGSTLPLGIGGTQAPSEFAYALADGETLLLYTDGLIERRTESVDARVERLMTAFGAGSGAAAMSCERVVERLLGDTRPDDDIAILAAYVRPPDTGPLRLYLESRPESVTVARHRLRDWLDREVPDLEPRLASDLEVAFSEATTNVVRHAYGPLEDAHFHASAIREGHAVELTVKDDGRWRSPRPSDGGRGLAVVDAVCDEVTVESDRSGTLVRMRWPTIA